MLIKPALSFFALCAFASVSIVACSANTDDATEEPASEVQDQELRKSITSCSSDSDCVAVPRGGCCQNGYNEAVNKHHTKAYENATKCTLSPRPFCPQFLVLDKRIAQCDTGAHQCKMVANNTASILGSWGATGAIMTITDGHADIEFGCGGASIDSFTWSNPHTFTATGTQTRGSGVQPPPGHEPQPVPATFTGHVSASGTTLTLTMTVSGNASTYTFTKDRQINLFRCL